MENHTSTQKKAAAKPLLLVIGFVVIGALGFGSGILYQKGQATAPQDGLSQQGGTMMGPGEAGSGGRMRMNGMLGSVTAVGDTSITVQDTQTNSEVTYTVDSSTKIMSNGATAALTDIKVGDTVGIQAESAGSKKATGIVINPTMRGPTTSTPSADEQSSDAI
jgi:hypothetical protein